jgi:hypothetical protein
MRATREFGDGYAIADEYRMTGSSGELIVLGTNFRAYDATQQTWNMKWLNALAGTWVDLGPTATYMNISDGHFTWRGDQSEDGKTWAEFMVVEAHRSDE